MATSKPEVKVVAFEDPFVKRLKTRNKLNSTFNGEGNNSSSNSNSRNLEFNKDQIWKEIKALGKESMTKKEKRQLELEEIERITGCKKAKIDKMPKNIWISMKQTHEQREKQRKEMVRSHDLVVTKKTYIGAEATTLGTTQKKSSIERPGYESYGKKSKGYREDPFRDGLRFTKERKGITFIKPNNISSKRKR